MAPSTCQKSGGFHQHGVPQEAESNSQTAGARLSTAVFHFSLPHCFSECDLECTRLMKTTRFLAGPPHFSPAKNRKHSGMGTSNGTRFWQTGERALGKYGRCARQRCPVGALKQAVQPTPITRRKKAALGRPSKHLGTYFRYRCSTRSLIS